MNNLKKLRNELDLSIYNLSDKTNINHVTLNRLENGITALNNTYIEILCKFYNVSSDYLLGFSKVRTSFYDTTPIPLLSLSDFNAAPEEFIKADGISEDSIKNYFYIKIWEPSESLPPFIPIGSRALLNKKRVDCNFRMCYVMLKDYDYYIPKFYDFIDGQYLIYESLKLKNIIEIVDESKIIGFVERLYLDFKNLDVNDYIHFVHRSTFFIF